jgi:uncharacterized protein involved in exopolysaccharide biosynthesis
MQRFLFVSSVFKTSRRNLGLVVLFAAIGTVLGLLYATTGRVVFVSNCEIELDTRRLNTPPSQTEAILKVRERLSPDELSRIASECNVYPDWRSRRPVEEVASRMKQDILIDLVNSNLFRVSFRSEDPDLAQRVADQIAILYEPKFQTVSEEVLNKLNQAETELSRQEERLRDLNTRFLGSHLEQQTENLKSLNRAILQLRSNVDMLNRLEREKATQERILAEHDQPRRETDPPELGQTKLSSVNTANRDESSAPSRPTNHLPPTADSRNSQSPHLDVRTEDPGSSHAKDEARDQLQRLDEQIKRNAQEHERIRKEMSFYQARVDSAPQVKRMHDAALSAYEAAKQNYQNLLTRKNELELSNRQGESQFSVAKPASFPEEALGRSKLGFALLGCFLGVCVGVGLSVIRGSEAEPPLREEELMRLTDLPVLASIPRIASDDSGVEVTTTV